MLVFGGVISGSPLVVQKILDFSHMFDEGIARWREFIVPTNEPLIHQEFQVPKMEVLNLIRQFSLT